jgi:hypothetical protein
MVPLSVESPRKYMPHIGRVSCLDNITFQYLNLKYNSNVSATMETSRKEKYKFFDAYKCPFNFL